MAFLGLFENNKPKVEPVGNFKIMTERLHITKGQCINGAKWVYLVTVISYLHFQYQVSGLNILMIKKFLRYLPENSQGDYS